MMSGVIMILAVTTFQHLYNEQGVVTPILAILRAATRVTMRSLGNRGFFFVVTGHKVF